MPLLATILAAIYLSAMTGTKIVERPAFDVIGIGVRTNNAKEITTNGAIPKQWGRFFQEGLLAKIPDRVDDTIYAVYSDYQKDRHGEYDFTIGVAVKSTATVPASMVVKHVPAGKYAIVASANGPVAQVVPEAWRQVWKLEDSSELGGARAYRSDFEVYDQRARDPQASQVDIYVGVK